MISDLLGLVSKFVPDKSAAKKLEADIAKAHSKALQAGVKADVEIKLAEIKRGGISAVWRPISAIMTFSIIFLYWFIYPLCQMIIAFANLNVYLPELETLPLEFYGLATAFISIYAYGRSLEKRSL